NQGVLAPVFNIGTLLAPTTKTQFLANSVPQPLSLLSHQDQQRQWQTAIADQDSRTGWGGRMGGTLAPGPPPPVISIAGNQLFVVGQSSGALAVPAAGGPAFGLTGFDTSTAAMARRTAMDHIRMQSDANMLEQATAADIDAALAAAK